MVTKYLMLAISSIALANKEGLLDSKNASMDSISKAIRSEILSIQFRLLLGVILISTVIFSIFQMGTTLEMILSQSENGIKLEFIIFGGIVLLSLATLFLLFHPGQTSTKENKKTTNSQPTLDLQNIASNFVEGFTVGFEKNNLEHRGITNAIKY